MSKRFTAVILMVMMAVANLACKKLNNLEVPDNSYDVVNKVFHVIANANNVPLNVSVIQIRPGADANPYNAITAVQNPKFNYGFTPAVGDTIKVNLSAASAITVNISYIGKPLDGVNVVGNSSGSQVKFVYVVKE